jgi:nicotinate-nucleotide--dimethylbenzimidazole phosphoribosyltransferase
MSTPSNTALPFDDIRTLLRSMPKADETARASAHAREAYLTKPSGSLGRLEEIAHWLSAWQAKYPPSVDRPLVAIFAANHGVAKHGVSAFPQSVTRQMLENFSSGGAAINQICVVNNIGLKIFDLAIDVPTQDILEGPALTEAECAATMAFGMEAIAGGTDLLAVGEMGIANTTIAAAICYALYGGTPQDWVGRGTGVDGAAFDNKVDVVRRAIELHGTHSNDPLEILRRVGGREIAAMAGAILAARHQRVPVLLDGYVCGAAAAILHALDTSALDHCIAGHCSAEAPHARLLEKLGKKPLLDLGMRLGEGSGAALAVGIVKAAAACHNDMATFDTARVDRQSHKIPQEV